jgi:hypothetical protein
MGRQVDDFAHVAGLLGAPERIRTSTTYSGHKALNLVTQGLELTYASIRRNVSAADDARKGLCRPPRKPLRHVAEAGQG